MIYLTFQLTAFRRSSSLPQVSDLWQRNIICNLLGLNTRVLNSSLPRVCDLANINTIPEWPTWITRRRPRRKLSRFSHMLELVISARLPAVSYVFWPVVIRVSSQFTTWLSRVLTKSFGVSVSSLPQICPVDKP